MLKLQFLKVFLSFSVVITVGVWSLQGFFTNHLEEFVTTQRQFVHPKKLIWTTNLNVIAETWKVAFGYPGLTHGKDNLQVTGLAVPSTALGTVPSTGPGST